MTDIFFSRTNRPRTDLDPVFRLVSAIGPFFAEGYGRYRQRQALAELDDHLLADLALSREDVRRECARSWWPV